MMLLVPDMLSLWLLRYSTAAFQSRVGYLELKCNTMLNAEVKQRREIVPLILTFVIKSELLILKECYEININAHTHHNKYIGTYAYMQGGTKVSLQLFVWKII